MALLQFDKSFLMDSLALLGRALSIRNDWHPADSALPEVLKSDSTVLSVRRSLLPGLFMCPQSGILAGLKWLKGARSPL